MTNHAYKDDMTPADSWALLAEQPNAVLIDVRTDAEWAYVGIPDLSSINKETALVAWQEFPQMEVNPNFVDQVRGYAPDPSQPILFLCRSGVRSKSAADALTAAGYENCYNVLEGFEGDKDVNGHRGTIGGWKFRDLPWKQR